MFFILTDEKLNRFLSTKRLSYNLILELAKRVTSLLNLSLFQWIQLAISQREKTFGRDIMPVLFHEVGRR